MLVKELMSPAVAVEKVMSLAEAASLMSEKRIDSLLVMKGGRLSGIVTERDLLKNFGKSRSIQDIMTTDLITVGPKVHVNDALDIMREHQIKRLPVLQKDALVGIVSLVDIAAHVDELEGDFFFE